jgi:DNA invertase Pin-like site-specific DNA recombinase
VEYVRAKKIRHSSSEVSGGDSVAAREYTYYPRHGDRVTHAERQEVARQILKEHPHLSQAEIARRLHVTQQTVGRWTKDIAGLHKLMMDVRAELMARMGPSQTAIVKALKVSRPTVTRKVQNTHQRILNHLTEPLLTEALELWGEE